MPAKRARRSNPGEAAISVWYQLQLANGHMSARTTKVTITSGARLEEFIDAVKAKEPASLSTVDATRILAYGDRTSFNNRNNGAEALRSSLIMDGLGDTEDNAIIVVVPTSGSPDERLVFYELHQYTPNFSVIRSAESNMMSRRSRVSDIVKLMEKKFTAIVSRDVEVYEDMDDFQGRAQMERSKPIGSELGSEASNPIIIVIPWSCVTQIDPLEVPCVRDGKLYAKGEDQTPTKFVVAKKEWLHHSGVSERGAGDTWLYIRDQCEEQLKFMEQHLGDENVVPIPAVYGQAGTGKSMMALVFALSQAVHRKWVVMWIHLNPGCKGYECVVISGTRMICRVCKLENIKRSTIYGWGDDVEKNSRKLLVIDGYVNNEQLGNIRSIALSWYQTNRSLNRLCFVSSMASGPLICPKGQEGIFQIAKFLQVSWKYEEYEAAISNDDFRNAVAGVLVADDTSAERVELNLSLEEGIKALRSKFYYAGSCARFMFALTTSKVKELIENTLSSTDDAEALLRLLLGGY